jgi:hypothetical protein
MTAVAAGSVAATTATRVAVTAGVTYQGYGFFAGVTAIAGRTTSVRIDWYTAATGGTLISSFTGPSTTMANATTWNTPPPQATAMAPATATHAAVTLIVTGLTAGSTVAADTIVFGVPFTLTGNLLPYASSSLEQDNGGWGAWTNVTVARSSTAAQEGWYSLLLTSAAAGFTGSGSVEVEVQPGTEYVGRATVQAGQSGTFRIDIRWYDSSSAYLGDAATSFAEWSVLAGQWKKCKVAAVAPPTATRARLTLRPRADAAGQTWLVDLMALLPTSAVSATGQMLPYNTADIEVDTSGWSVTGGTTAQSTDEVWRGDYGLKITATGGTPLTITGQVPVGRIVPDRGHQFVTFLKRGAGVLDGSLFETRISWVNDVGTITRTRWQNWAAGTSTGWLIGTMADIAPLDAVSATVQITIKNPVAGEAWYADSLYFGLGGLTVQASEAPGGGAALTVRGLTTVIPQWTWQLHRIVPGNDPQPVRGWLGDLVDQPITGDVFVVTDHEAPLGVPVSWRAVLNDNDSPSSFSYTSDSLILTADDLSVWLKDPGLPARSTKAVVGTPLPTWTRPARQGVNQVRGRSRPVVISDVRGSRSGSIVLVTETEGEKDALWWVLDSGGPLLLQWPPGWGQDDMYVSVGDVDEAPITGHAEHMDRAWTLPLTEVDRPIGGIAGSADRTWQTVKDTGTSWTAATGGAQTWLGVYTGTEI